MWPFFQPMSRVFPLTFDVAGGSAPNGRYLEGIEGGSGTFFSNHMQTLSFANSSSAHSSLRANTSLDVTMLSALECIVIGRSSQVLCSYACAWSKIQGTYVLH